MGDGQEMRLLDGIGASRSRWQLLANQVMVEPYDSDSTDAAILSMDQWSGYPVARDRRLTVVAQRAPNRTVVITGDIHSNWVNEPHSDFFRPDRPSIAAEFVATSISSGGDGSAALPATANAALAANPHVEWHNRQTGYVSCTIEADSWHTEYRTVPSVS